MDLVYGIPTLAALLLAFAYVRCIARRERKQRGRRTGQPLTYSVRSLSQRSEMRAGDDVNSVMQDMQHTHFTPLSKHPPRTPSRKRREGTSTRAKRE